MIQKKISVSLPFIVAFVFVATATFSVLLFSLMLKQQQNTQSEAASVLSETSSAPRGNPWDLWADVVLGQRDFGEVTAREVVPDKLNNPAGVIVDRSVTPGRMYIWDSGNSRILGVDLAECYASTGRCQPSIVLGQPTARDYGACNQDASFSDFSTRAPARADTLCGVWEGTQTQLEDKSFASMGVDRMGNLYVPDTNNHRVLQYKSPFTTDRIADRVWGQADFTGNLCNRRKSQDLTGHPTEPIPAPTAETICFDSLGGGVTADPRENVWVADSGNNRVLRFPPNSSTADLVLGQPDFTSREAGLFSRPIAVRVDLQGNVWVANFDLSKIMKFSPPFANGMAPTAVWGDSSLFTMITNIEVDPLGRGIWVTDFTNGNSHRLFTSAGQATNIRVVPGLHAGGSIGFDTNASILYSNYAISNVELASWVVPPPDNCRQHDGNSTACQAEGNCAYYGCTNQCWPYGTSNQTACAGIPAGGGYGRMRNLYLPPVDRNLTSIRRLENTSWTGIATLRDQLIVADGRLLFWNGLSSLTNGKTPSGYVGASTGTTIPEQQYGQVKTDTAARVWASTLTNIQVYQGPLQTGQQTLAVIQGAIPVKGGGTITLSGIHGIAPTPDGSALWVSMAYHQHRVVRIQNPITNPQIDVVLGQQNVSGTYCNRDSGDPRNENPWGGPSNNDTISTLCWPGAISLDRKGNLYVADHLVEIAGNHRMLVFENNLFGASTTSRSALFAVKASKVFPRGIGENSHSHFEMAFNSKNVMVVGQNPYTGKRFLEYYLDPLKRNPFNPFDAEYARRDGTLGDFYNWPVALTFDANDNLYAYDANHSKVLIYKTPVFEY